MSKIEELMSKMKALQEELKELAKKDGEAIIMEIFQPLFDLGITSATFQQYTPYFNDGEACEFGVYADDMKLTWPNGYEGEAWDVEYYNNPVNNRNERYGAEFDAKAALVADLKAIGPAVDEADRAISRTLSEMEEMLRYAFGDHAEITVTPQGVTVEEYNHD